MEDSTSEALSYKPYKGKWLSLRRANLRKRHWNGNLLGPAMNTAKTMAVSMILAGLLFWMKKLRAGP